MVPLRHYVGGYYKYFLLPTNKGSGGEGAGGESERREASSEIKEEI